MWHKNKMFVWNKKVLDKCSIRAYYCGVRTNAANEMIIGRIKGMKGRFGL